MIWNYDGGITASPAQLVSPESVAEIQSILREADRYPGPVRAMGSYHSLTPCVSSDGTIINMSGIPGASLFAGSEFEDWRVEDPFGDDVATYRRICDDIEARVADLAARIRAQHI